MATPSPPPAVAPPVAVPEPNLDDLQLIALLADLQRFGNLSPDELRREMGAATQALARQRTDANRVRLAVLYSLSRASPQDDQRAMQLLDNVVKGGPGSASIKQLAVVLQAQIVGAHCARYATSSKGRKLPCRSWRRCGRWSAA